MYKRKFSDLYMPRKAIRTINANYSSSYPRGATTRRYNRPGKGIKALVNKVISRNEEKKESNIYSLNHPLPSSSNGAWVSSSVRLSPGSSGFVIPNGTGQGNRIGNKIRVEKAWVKGIIHALPYNATSNLKPSPVQIRMLLFKDKFKSTEQPAALALDLFQTGSTSIGPQDDLVDMVLDINRDRYQVYYDQILKLGTASFTGVPSGTDPTYGAGQFHANNDFSYNVAFNVDITKFLPKNIVFNDTVADPMSDSLWMIFMVVPATGAAAGSTTVSASAQYSANIEYTDA